MKKQGGGRSLTGLGTLIEERRRAAGLTQRDLAERSGVSIGAIRDLEQGRTSRPRPGAAERLARALGLCHQHLARLADQPRGRQATGAPRGQLPAQGESRPAGSVRLNVLGPLAVWRDGAPASLGAERQRAVLALLAMQPGSAVHRESLIDAIWGEAPPPSAVSMVQSYVSWLRRLLGADAGSRPSPGREPPRRAGLVVSAGTSYLLQVSSEQLDVLEFGGLVSQARNAVAAGDAAGACEFYERAAGLWRGEPAADVSLLRGHPAVAGLARQRAAAVLEYAEAASAAGWHERALEHVRALADREPLDERAHARLMIGLAATGQQGAALQLFEQVRVRLDHELGVGPGAELSAAHLQILRGGANGRGAAGDPAGREAAAGGVARGLGPGPRAKVPRGGVVLPRQLPSSVRHFGGRSRELRELRAVLDQAGGRPGAVVISAIGGMAGVGKTALAVHFAREAAERFPDGQLFADLRGVGPADGPAEPAQVIQWFLGSLGVPAQQVPADPRAQAALYRSVLADRRVLIVLDNARDADQVRPLLPGSPGCLVLVTSRARLTGLAVADGAHLMALDVLAEGDAYELLGRRLSAGRLAAEPRAAAALIELCDGLPLALAITAARAADRPGFALAELAGELLGDPGRLDALDTGEPASSIRQVFWWSYRQLTDPAARMFRLLGIHPGPDISAPAAASLAGTRAGRARQALAELADAHLLAEPVPGRYALHDLLRAYATEQAHATDTGQDRHAAVHRGLGHYLHTARRAALLISPAREPILIAPSAPGITPEPLADHHEAMAWFDAEQHVLVSATALAAEAGFDVCAWQLPWAMMNFLDRRGHWHEQAGVQHTALDAASRLGDRAAQATARRSAAYACARLAQYGQAHAHLAECLDLWRQLGDQAGEGRAHLALSWVFGCQGRHSDALGHAEQALSLFLAAGDRAGQANARNNIGWCRVLLGDYSRGRAFCQQALALNRQLGERRGEAHSWDSLGYAEHKLGNLTEAAGCYRHALGLFREFGDRYLQGQILAHLGDTHRAAGDLPQARDAWRQALGILDDLHHPDAGEVRAKLCGLSRPADASMHWPARGGRSPYLAAGPVRK